MKVWSKNSVASFSATLNLWADSYDIERTCGFLYSKEADWAFVPNGTRVDLAANEYPSLVLTVRAPKSSNSAAMPIGGIYGIGWLQR